MEKSDLKNKKSGFTLVEVIFGVAMLIITSAVVTNFSRNIFETESYLQTSFRAEDSARNILRGLTAEIRSMNYSALGGYPISEATSDSLTFYSDINGDGHTEQLRYFLDGTLLKKGVVYPTGDPLSYNQAAERISVLASGIISGSDVFYYYGNEYNGTGDPLEEPIDLLSVSLIKIEITLNISGTKIVVPYVIESQASMRNLKQNL